MHYQIFSLIKTKTLAEKTESTLEYHCKVTKGNINSKGFEWIKTLNKQLLVKKEKEEVSFEEL